MENQWVKSKPVLERADREKPQSILFQIITGAGLDLDSQNMALKVFIICPGGILKKKS